MKERARFLRKNQTPAENALWYALRNRKFYGFKFLRQHPAANYILDFVCLEKKLVVEIDGEVHLHQQEYDIARDDYLNSAGFKVIRFWNHQIFQERDKVLKQIYKNLI
jgi:5-methyltetrahydrofolate--homocysteine methyltransferase